MRIGTTEIILIVILALILFGGNKLSGVGKALGKSIREFKNEVREDSETQSESVTEENTVAKEK